MITHLLITAAVGFGFWSKQPEQSGGVINNNYSFWKLTESAGSARADSVSNIFMLEYNGLVQNTNDFGVANAAFFYGADTKSLISSNLIIIEEQFLCWGWIRPQTNSNQIVVGHGDWNGSETNSWVLFLADGNSIYFRGRDDEGVNFDTSASWNYGIKTGSILTASYLSGQPGVSGNYTNLSVSGGTGNGGTLDVTVEDGGVVTISSVSTTEADGTYSNISVSGGSGTGLVLDYQIVMGSVVSITVVNSGTLYQVNDQPSSGSTSLWNVDTVKTVVTSVVVNNGGTSYSPGDDVTITGTDIGGISPDNDTIFNVDTLTGQAFPSLFFAVGYNGSEYAFWTNNVLVGSNVATRHVLKASFGFGTTSNSGNYYTGILDATGLSNGFPSAGVINYWYNNGTTTETLP